MKFEEELIARIKQKKELRGLDDATVRSLLDKTSFPSLQQYLSFDQAIRNSQVKAAISQIRKRLREVYGVFLDRPLRAEDVAGITDRNDPRTIELLRRHKSTQERLPYYGLLYSRLFDDRKDLVVLDVACGYNPFALHFFTHPPSNYVACDLSSSEMLVIDEFLANIGQKGSAFGVDVFDPSFLSWLADRSFDVVLLLKALDSFESVQRHFSKKLLSAINASRIIVSFPLVSIGGKNVIRAEKRSWLERFCDAQGWSWSTFQLPNELFYVIEKVK